ncbi:MAG: hypothetical protein VYD19_06220 [Myxococcota bacterium]|nr:hypothetical protein [Myxococcota bacterium]
MTTLAPPTSLSRQPIELSRFPSNIQKFLDPNAPATVAQLVVRGVVPMPPLVRLCALYQISHFGPEELRREAADAVTSMPRELIEPLLSQALPGDILDWIAVLFCADVELIGALLANELTPLESLERLASTGEGPIIERLALNQVRLLREPILIQRLYFNTALRPSSADRLLELAAREGVDLSWLPESEALISSIGEGRAHAGEEEDQLFQELHGPQGDRTGTTAGVSVSGLTQGSIGEEVPRATEQLVPRSKGAEGPTEGKRLTPAQRIQKMNVSSKVRLALLGNQSERALLIRDANKVVSRAAIRSPAVSESEALLYARNNALSADVIEYISKNKKWMRSYPIKVSIVMNPKTPAHTALQYLTHLRPADLNSIVRSHSVPSIVRQRAQAILKARKG